MNRPSWANNAKFDNETSQSNTNTFECKPYKIRIVGVVDKPEYEASIVYFDITEQGSLQGFFSKDWKAKGGKTFEDWNNKGRYFLSYKESAQQMFEAFITSVQNSNQGYQWDWNEQSLKGKDLVMVYGEEEFIAKDGSIKTTISPRQPRSIRALNNNEIKYPLPVKRVKPNKNTGYQQDRNRPTQYTQNAYPNHNEQQSYQQPQYSNDIVNDDDLPF